MTRFRFWFWPFAIAAVGSGALLCVAWGFNPFSWAWARLLEFGNSFNQGGR